MALKVKGRGSENYDRMVYGKWRREEGCMYTID